MSVTKLIAKIFGAVVAAKPSLALRNGQMIAHCGCQNNGIKSGVGVPPNLITKPTILRNCGRSFLSVTRLIAKIFGAVSRTKA